VFVAALKEEVIQLRARVQAAEHHWEQRRRRCVTEVEPPERVVRLQAQLDEATRLLDALKAQGADVQFFTNEEPPFLNTLAVNHGLAELVDGERGMQWIADRFNGLPTTPNCGEV
jgi:phosphoglycolate phosphatase-like HAD superfamily hydrolase